MKGRAKTFVATNNETLKLKDAQNLMDDITAPKPAPHTYQLFLFLIWNRRSWESWRRSKRNAAVLRAKSHHCRWNPWNGSVRRFSVCNNPRFRWPKRGVSSSVFDNKQSDRTDAPFVFFHRWKSRGSHKNWSFYERHGRKVLWSMGDGNVPTKHSSTLHLARGQSVEKKYKEEDYKVSDQYFFVN